MSGASEAAKTSAWTPPKTVDVTDFDEVREAWKCPHLTSSISGPGEEYFHQGTVLRLDGEQHAFRRKVMGTLLARRGHAAFRERWLFPTADAALEEILAKPDPDGYCRVNLLRWALRVNQQLAAALTGLDGATSPEGGQELFDLLEKVITGRPTGYQITTGAFDEKTPAMRAALESKRKIIEKFYNPSLERRRKLVAEVNAGKRDAADLPIDLLTLIAQGADPAWLDPAMGEREAIFLLSAAVHTTALSLVWTLGEIFLWIEGHPERLERLKDEASILLLAQEALRLHPVVPGFTRGALQDVELQHGTKIPQDALAVIRSGPAAASKKMYGDNALEFDPDRPIPAGHSRYGFAFGTGPHMCFGMPLVMGTGGVDGSLVYLLKKLLDAGCRPDPDKPTFDAAAIRGRFGMEEVGEDYPVIFPAPRKA